MYFVKNKMIKPKKIIFRVFISMIFFTWGGTVAYYKIFPYNFIDFIKDNTYDKIFKTQYKDLSKDPNHKFSYYYNKYPNFKWNESNIVMYSKKTNIWYDRLYYNHENDEKLLNFYIIKKSRHSTKDISVNFLYDVEIYRPICELNDNSEYKNWDIADFTVAIIGYSCVHTKVVKKKFKKGTIILKSGGPISSDPIFIFGKLDINKTRIN